MKKFLEVNAHNEFGMIYRMSDEPVNRNCNRSISDDLHTKHLKKLISSTVARQTQIKHSLNSICFFKPPLLEIVDFSLLSIDKRDTLEM